MMNHSRREFFKSILPNKPRVQSRDEDVVDLGYLGDFPVHSKSKIQLKDLELTLESLPEGVRLRDVVSHKHFKLSLSGGGLLRAHLKEEWPETAVLSIFTGEMNHL